MTSRILRLRALIEHTGLSRSAIYDRLDAKSPRHDPSFPKSFQLGGQAVGWYEAEVDAFLDRRIENVMQFEKLKGQVKDAFAKMPDPMDLFGSRKA